MEGLGAFGHLDDGVSFVALVGVCCTDKAGMFPTGRAVLITAGHCAWNFRSNYTKALLADGTKIGGNDHNLNDQVWHQKYCRIVANG